MLDRLEIFFLLNSILPHEVTHLVVCVEFFGSLILAGTGEQDSVIIRKRTERRIGYTM